jgi:tetratricopeptide (TPR) repeat protein
VSSCALRLNRLGGRTVLKVLLSASSIPRLRDHPTSTNTAAADGSICCPRRCSRRRAPPAEFEAAIAIDSTYTPAHAGLALAWCAQASLRVVPHADAYGHAKAAALRALAMDDGSADAQAALGCVLFLSEWDWDGAARSLDRALDLEPRHTQAQLLRGQLFEGVGQLEAGLAMKQRALERDPSAPHVLLQISLSYWNQRRYDRSLEWATKALAIDPKLLLAREHVIGVYWKTGDFERMMAENVTQAESFGAPLETIDRIRELGREMMRAYAAGARLAVMRLMREFASQHTQPAAAIQMAVLSGEVGDLDAAFHHLDRALETRDPSLVHLAVAPQWDSLRGDPRLSKRLVRMRLPAMAKG